MSLFHPSRDEVRQFFFETWRKYRQSLEMTPLEGIALQVVLMHPEYHEVLDAPERYAAREYFPEMGETNPFLHMSLHVSVMEQLSINQPPGISEIYQSLLRRHGEPHPAQHDVLECLAETIWKAQRERAAPDGPAYLACLRGKAGAE